MRRPTRKLASRVKSWKAEAEAETMAEQARRVELLRPFFEYCERACISPTRVVTRICMRRGIAPWSRQRVYSMKRGYCLTPEWFIREACAEIGRPVAEVMGVEWVRARAGVSGCALSGKAG